MNPPRVVIFGASRGLGRELALRIASSNMEVVGFSRKENLLKEMAATRPHFRYQVADFAKEPDQERVLSFLRENRFDKVFLVAGGGPYGFFHQRTFKDHLWAWETSFVFHAKVLHLLASAELRPQTVVVGSSVAESEPDPKAASYCAAKHALKGLVLSLRAENPDWDLRLFSPGYMDTDLLPKNAAVRKRGVHNAARVAEDLWQWSLTPSLEGHKMDPQLQENL